jgi:OOP family OmpA-OmpF porin
VLTVRPGQPASARVTMYDTGTTVTGGLVRLTRPILFDVASSTLRADALPILDDVARRLVVDRTAALVEIQGHTSDEGGVAYNQQLSEARARAIREALVERGVEPERLVSRGYGLARPLSPQRDEESRAANRRVELVILDRIDLR